MKTHFILVVLFLVETHGLHKFQRDPVEDPALIKDGYICLPRDFEVGPMKQNEVKVVDGECVKITCRSEGFVEYQGCQIPPSGGLECHVEHKNEQKTFPKCCGTWVCVIR